MEKGAVTLLKRCWWWYSPHSYCDVTIHPKSESPGSPDYANHLIFCKIIVWKREKYQLCSVEFEKSKSFQNLSVLWRNGINVLWTTFATFSAAFFGTFFLWFTHFCRKILMLGFTQISEKKLWLKIILECIAVTKLGTHWSKSSG